MSMAENTPTGLPQEQTKQDLTEALRQTVEKTRNSNNLQVFIDRMPPSLTTAIRGGIPRREVVFDMLRLENPEHFRNFKMSSKYLGDDLLQITQQAGIDMQTDSSVDIISVAKEYLKEVYGLDIDSPPPRPSRMQRFGSGLQDFLSQPSSTYASQSKVNVPSQETVLPQTGDTASLGQNTSNHQRDASKATEWDHRQWALEQLDNLQKEPIIQTTENMSSQTERQPTQKTPISEEQIVANWQEGVNKDGLFPIDTNLPPQGLNKVTVLEKEPGAYDPYVEIEKLKEKISYLEARLERRGTTKGKGYYGQKRRADMRFYPSTNAQNPAVTPIEKQPPVQPPKPESQIANVQEQIEKAQEDLYVAQNADFSPNSDERIHLLRKNIADLSSQQKNLKDHQKESEIARLKQELERDEFYFGLTEPHLSNMEKARIHGDILWRKHQLKKLQEQPPTPPFTEPVTEEKPLVVKEQPPTTRVAQPQQLDIEPEKKVEAEEAIEEDIILDPEYFMRKDSMHEKKKPPQTPIAPKPGRVPLAEKLQLPPSTLPEPKKPDVKQGKEPISVTPSAESNIYKDPEAGVFTPMEKTQIPVIQTDGKPKATVAELDDASTSPETQQTQPPISVIPQQQPEAQKSLTPVQLAKLPIRRFGETVKQYLDRMQRLGIENPLEKQQGEDKIDYEERMTDTVIKAGVQDEDLDRFPDESDDEYFARVIEKIDEALQLKEKGNEIQPPPEAAETPEEARVPAVIATTEELTSEIETLTPAQRTSRIRGLASKVSGLFRKTPRGTPTKAPIPVDQPAPEPEAAPVERLESKPDLQTLISKITSTPYDPVKDPFTEISHENKAEEVLKNMRKLGAKI